MSRPLITIIVAAYNAARTLEKCVSKIARLSGIEIIIINDASTDATGSVAENLCSGYNCISLINQENNSGPLIARLEGIKQSRGEYIAFLDAGDMIYPRGLRQVVDYLKWSKTDADILLAKINLYFKKIRKTIPYSSSLPFSAGEIITDQNQLHKFWLGVLRGNSSAQILDKIFRRDFLLKHLPQAYPLYIGEDYYLCSHLFMRARKIEALDLTLYRWTFSGMGAKYFTHKWADYTRSLSITIESVKEACRDSHIHPLEPMRAMAELYFFNLRQACIYRYWRNRVREFIQRVFSTEIYKEFSSVMPVWEGIDTQNADSEKWLKNAREYLMSHKKYFLATRLL